MVDAVARRFARSALHAPSNAAESFHDAWRPRLGLDYKPGVSKEHWKRIWALSRRLSTPGLGDEYDNLKPVADLRKQLQDRLYVLLQNPVRWDPVEPTDDEHKQQVFGGLVNALSAKMLDLAARRVRSERMQDWRSAFNQSGRGSSYTRASIISERIFERAAPIPDVTPRRIAIPSCTKWRLWSRASAKRSAPSWRSQRSCNIVRTIA